MAAKSQAKALSPSLRPIRPDDRDFLYQVYASTRQEELAPLGWDRAQVDAFLEMQFAAQHDYYQEQFPKGDFQVVLLDGRPVGRLYLDRREDEIRIVDIALLTENRGAGVGGALMAGILDEAAPTGLPVRIHVEKNNRALGLYQRLGFLPIADRGVYHLMERLPG